MPKFKPTAKLSNPTHKIVGPDGVSEFFIIRQTRNTVRARILFDAPNWVDITPAGTVSQAYGPSAADGIMMGDWVGPLAYQFTNDALDLLPDGAHCIELDHEASDFDYRTQVVWSGWLNAPSQFSESGFTRANGFKRMTLPLFRDETAKARALLDAHLAQLRGGTFAVEGIDYTPQVIAEFIADAEVCRAYCDFLDSIPEMPRRQRRARAA